MLDQDIIKKIEDFVYKKPRSIQEIAQLIGKNWRTADRYLKEIETSYGTIASRTFREGTRGALRIVYWAAVEKVSHSVFQERLENEIMRARKKEDFSAFDIYQYVADSHKRAIVEKAIDEDSTNLIELAELLKNVKSQLICLSGNLSFINLKNRAIDMFKILEDLVKRGVTIKVICRVDIAGKNNIEKLLSLNFKYGKQLVEIRHKEQPIRAFIMDKQILRIKEIKEPTGKMHELDKKIFIFYTIKDKEWTEWMSSIFWKMFSSSMDAQKRIEELKKLR